MKRRSPQGFTRKKRVAGYVRSGFDKSRRQVRNLYKGTTNLITKGTSKCAGAITSYFGSLSAMIYSKTVAKYIKRPKRMSDFWAVDIGIGSIRMARLNKTESGYALREYYEQNYDYSENENLRKEARATALRELLQRVNAYKKDVVFGISGQSVFTRVRTLPPVPESKILQIVRYEIQQRLPFGLDQICLDYQILGRGERGEYEVLMLAVKQDVVNNYINIFEEAGCRVHGVGVDGIAAFNWLKYSGQLESTDTNSIAVVDIGALNTEVVCLVDGQFRFTRPLNVACRDITVAANPELSRRIFAVGNESDNDAVLDAISGSTFIFAPTGSVSNEAPLTESSPEGLANANDTPINPGISRLTSEVQRTFSYFRSLPGGGRINQIFLTGEGSTNTELGQYISRKSETSVIDHNSLEKLDVEHYVGDELNPNHMATVLGLALGCHNGESIDVNLLP